MGLDLGVSEALWQKNVSYVASQKFHDSLAWWQR